MSRPDVSIVMPVFNGARFIEAAIASLQTQEGVSAEIIVVDDGSSDGTVDVVRRLAARDGRISLVEQPHRGVSAARNSGLRVASGRYVTFLDADDLCAPGKIARQIGKLAARPDVTAVVGHRIYFEEMAGRWQPAPGTLWERKLDICLASATFRAELFEQFGHFDEALRYGEDIDFYFRLFEADARFIIEMETAIYYRRHDANMTNDVETMLQQCLRAYHNSIVRRRTSGRKDRLNVFFFRTFKHETDFGGPASAPEAERAAR
ncbi:MAG: glycosyltransferase [Rhizobiales bacterium]|nr:glycosyltransferase [Hyphomicrobiales bacterium]MBN9010702.1 glycosyltransferase [Hyphomicrobiales bacterium]